MLTFETPFFESQGIVIFRDHASPTTYHYLAGPPKLTRVDNKPHFLLLKYKSALDTVSADATVRDQLGGGFLMFGVDCEVDDDTRQAMRQDLAPHLPDGIDPEDISLVPVLYTKGTVKVLALDHQGAAEAPTDDAPSTPQSRFVKGVLGTATPSLLQHQRAIFSIALSPDGVTLLEEAYQSELSPIGVMYDLEFSGLRPALSVEVHADQARIYEHFKLGLHVGVQTGGAASPPASGGGAESASPGTGRQGAVLTKQGAWPAGYNLTHTPATQGTQETLQLVAPGTPVVKVGTQAVTLNSNKGFQINLAAGETRTITVEVPAVTEQKGYFDVFFENEHPTEAEVASYQTGSPSPADPRFSTASGPRGQAATGSMPGRLQTWVGALPAPKRVNLDAYASWESTHGYGSRANQLTQNQALSQRRLTVVTSLIGSLATANAATPHGAHGDVAAHTAQRDSDQSDRVVKIEAITRHTSQARTLTASITRAAAGTRPTPAPTNQGTRVAVSADIDISLQKLEQEGALEIKIIQMKEGETEDKMREDALKLVRETLLKDFFSPAMTSQPTTSATQAAQGANQITTPTSQTSRGRTAPQAGGGTQVQIGFQLQYKRDDELKSITYKYSAATPEQRTHAPNGFFSALIDGTELTEHIRSINLDDEFFKVLQVETSTTADFQKLGLDALNVEMQYGGTPEAPASTGTISFRPDAHEARFFLPDIEGGAYTYRYRTSYKFTARDDIATQRFDYTSDWRTSTSRALVVHPPEEVAMLHIRIEPGVVDWALISRIEAHLSYSDETNGFHTERTFLLASGSERQEWIVRLSNPQQRSYQVRYTWHFTDDQEFVGETETRSDLHLYVPDPFTARLPITIYPQVEPANVGRVLVELTYEDPTTGLRLHKTETMIAPEFSPVEVEFPILDPDHKRYTYTIRLLPTSGGSAVETGPITTDSRSLIITEGDVVYYDVNTILLGDLAAAGVGGVQVDFRGEPPAGRPQQIQSHLFLPGQANNTSKRLVLRSDRDPEFEYMTTALMADGSSVVREWSTHNRTILPLQLAILVQPEE